VHQIELEMQNAELMLAKERAAFVAEKYTALYDFAPTGFFTLSAGGEILDLNLFGAHMLGKERINLKNSRFGFFLSENTRPVFNRFLHRIFNSGVPEFCEVSMAKDDHLPVIVKLSGIASGNEGQCLVSMMDITEQHQALEALKGSQLLLKSSLESQKDTILMSIDRDYRYLYFNRAHWESMKHAFNQDVKVGMNVLKCMTSEDDRKAAKDNLDRAFRGESHSNIRVFGHVNQAWYESFFNPIFNEQNEIIGATALARDVTERMRREIANLARLSLVEFAENHTWDELLEETLNQAEILTDSLIGFYHFVEADQETLWLQNWSTRTKKEFCRAEGKGSHYDLNLAGVWADCLRQRRPVVHNDYSSLPGKKGLPPGHAIVVREMTVPVIRGGLIKAILGVGNKVTDYTQKDIDAVSLIADLAWDIAERKRAEEALAMNSRLLSKLSRFSIELSMLSSEDDIEAFISRRLRELSGAAMVTFSEYNPDTRMMTPKYIEVEPGVIGEVMNLLDGQLNNAPCAVSEELYHEMTTEIVGARANLHDACFGTISRPAADAVQALLKAERFTGIAYLVEGKLYGTSLIGMEKHQPDIPREILENFIFLAAVSLRRYQMEARIKQQNEELFKTNAEKDKFFSIIAHDLRGPFNSFLGFTKMMVDDLHSLTPEEIQQIALSMRKSATGLFDLLENLLEWSRMKRGAIVYDPEPMIIKAVVVETLQPLVELADKKGISIDINVPDDLAIFADGKMFKSILRNLVSNAVKFTRRGGRITLSAAPEGTGFVEFSIRDNGVGMDKKLLDKLFLLDDQAYRKGTDGEPSTGLGLIICRDLVEKHGGKLWVESEDGVGSVFYFTMPINNSSR
jgi:PAS domain S-box-containing protein